MLKKKLIDFISVGIPYTLKGEIISYKQIKVHLYQEPHGSTGCHLLLLPRHSGFKSPLLHCNYQIIHTHTKKKSPFISGLAISQIKREFHPIVIVIEYYYHFWVLIGNLPTNCANSSHLLISRRYLVLCWATTPLTETDLTNISLHNRN